MRKGLLECFWAGLVVVVIAEARRCYGGSAYYTPIGLVILI